MKINPDFNKILGEALQESDRMEQRKLRANWAGLSILDSIESRGIEDPQKQNHIISAINALIREAPWFFEILQDAAKSVEATLGNPPNLEVSFYDLEQADF